MLTPRTPIECVQTVLHVYEQTGRSIERTAERLNLRPDQVVRVVNAVASQQLKVERAA